MADVFAALAHISSGRSVDPLRPVTVVTPSHAAGLHLRRRLARLGAFAGVRFETLPRIAELLAAGHLSGAGQAPLARPIGDYLAEVVARESRGSLENVREMPGYARTLRRIFARMRRAGIRRAADVPLASGKGDLREILRLYDAFREASAGFYDMEDLLDAAAEVCAGDPAGALPDLGDVYVVPPGPETAAGRSLVEALGQSGTRVIELDDVLTAGATHQFTIAPDPDSEAREVARSIVRALGEGTAIDEVGVFHGADSTYRVLLREALDAAGIPSTPLPGVPLVETRLGCGVLMLAELPDTGFARTAVLDFLTMAPIKRELPCGGGTAEVMTALWDNLSREAGVTRGADQWQARLGIAVQDHDRALSTLDQANDARKIAALEFARDQTGILRDVVAALVQRMEPLHGEHSADDFIDRFKEVVNAYLEPRADGYEEVMGEIDQLGSVGAIGGSLSLGSFARALRANLSAAYFRPRRLGDGVVISDYRVAAGMRFERVFLAGAYEGAFPAGPAPDAILDDGVWRWLKGHFPYAEDAQTRLDRARAAASRAVASAGDGAVSWWVPAHEAGGTRDLYPSPMMVHWHNDQSATLAGISASDLRNGIAGTARHIISPLAGRMRGPVMDPGELGLRLAVVSRKELRPPGPAHPHWRSIEMLRARHRAQFTEWDGLTGGGPLPDTISPTALEEYAACGFRYFARRVLRLRPVTEPAERDTMDPLTRGSLVHEVLEEFFRLQMSGGRPGIREAWTDADTDAVLDMARQRFEHARSRGETGHDLYADHDLRIIEADLTQFLVEDTTFRRETGGIPAGVEVDIPEAEIAGVKMRGRVDRVDRTPDGREAWVIDYKTGSSRDAIKIRDDPLQGGTKLQLPWYLSAAGSAPRATALYWYITQLGNFQQARYETTPDRERRFRETVEAIVAGIGAGVFPAVPGEFEEFYGAFRNCRYCDFRRICSVKRDLAFAAKMNDPSMEPWLAVGHAAVAEPNDA